jgi:hypothetical protein
MGMVNRISSVPVCCSSLHWRMVSAAARKIISVGIQRNMGRRSAMPRAKNSSTQKNVKSVAARNTPTKISAIGELK